MADENGKANEAGQGHNSPDFDLAKDIMRGDISDLRDGISKSQGDISAAWKRLEKEAGVNKAAAKAVFSLLQKSEETQTDFLRSFVGLCRAMGVGPSVDLVDLAQGGDGFKEGMPGGSGSLPTTDDSE